MEKIKKLKEKLFTKEVILYVVFGVGTSIINLASFFIMDSILKWNENISNLIAIILAVLFAYITNKDLVFHANAKTAKERITQFIKFMTGRAFTILIEFLGGIVLFKLPIPNIVVKIGLTVIVVILNFFISKFFAFKRKE